MAVEKEHFGHLVDAIDPVAGEMDIAATRRASDELVRMGPAAELVARGPSGEAVHLPAELLPLMLSALGELAAGHPVALVSEVSELSTSDAARHLGVSRPHVVSLIDRGILPHRKAGTHRRVRLTDVAAYKRRVERRHALLDELVSDAEAMGLYDRADRKPGE
jgi:excisionase family DNA binding protein